MGSLFLAVVGILILLIPYFAVEFISRVSKNTLSKNKHQKSERSFDAKSSFDAKNSSGVEKDDIIYISKSDYSFL